MPDIISEKTFKQRGNYKKLKSIPCKDLEKALIEYTKCEPENGFSWDTPWKTKWGNNNKFSACFNRTKGYVILADHSEGTKVTFFIANFNRPKQFSDGPITISAKKEFFNHEDVADEYNALKKPTQNDYMIEKGIAFVLPDLDTKEDKDHNLVVPIFSTKTKAMISFQTIVAGGPKKFRPGSLDGGYYHSVGNMILNNRVYLCEGLATACTIYRETKNKTFMCFSKGNIKNVLLFLLKEYLNVHIILCLDNDVKPNKNGVGSTYLCDIKDQRILQLCPDKNGCDFNDVRDDKKEMLKLQKVHPLYVPPVVTNNETIESNEKTLTRYSSSKEICQYIDGIAAEAIDKTDKKEIFKTEFYDTREIIPKNNAFLLSGATESGKTRFILHFLREQLLKGTEVWFFTHSETNRGNRLNQWVNDFNLEKTNFNTSFSKQEIIKNMRRDVIVVIDDCDSFFRIRNTTDRREVADVLESISLLCQFKKFSCIMCHYQTKASKKETNVICRSGGDLSWLNKIRYAALIEQGDKIDDKPTVSQSNEQEIRSEKRSFLTLQKGNRNKELPDAWWLTTDYEIDCPMSEDTLKDQIRANIDGSKIKDEINELNDLIQDQYRASGKQEIERKTLYRLSENLLGMKVSQVNYILRRYLKNYKNERSGYGKDTKDYIIPT